MKRTLQRYTWVKKSLIFFLILTVGTISQLFGQTNTWNGNSGDANWNTPANWSLNLVPTSAHDVVIPNGITATININTIAACKSFTISGGGNTNIVSISGTNSLSVTNGITIGAGTHNNDDKILAVGGGSLSCSSITVAATGSNKRSSGVTLSTGAVTVTGNISMGDANDGFTFTGAGTLAVGGTMAGGTFTASTGTVIFNGSSAQTIHNDTYNFYNVTVSNTSAGGASFGANVSAANIINNITVTGAGAYLNNTTNLPIARTAPDAITVDPGATFDAGTSSISWTGAGGAITINGTFRTSNTNGFSGAAGTAISSTNTPTITLGANSTIEYDDASVSGQTITSRIYSNLTLSNTSGTQTVNGALTINGVLTTTSAVILNMGTYQLLGTLATVTNGGTIQTQNTTTTPIPTGRTWGGTIQYNATTGGQTVMAGTYNNLTLGNTSGTQALSGSITVNGTLAATTSGILNLGTFTSSSNALSLGGMGVINGSWGSSSSTATHTNDTNFAATTGILNIASNTCTPPAVSISGSSFICINNTTTLSPATGGTWVSSNTGLATVTNGGLVKGVAAGSTTFTFTQTSTGCSNTTSAVTVNSLSTTAIVGATQNTCNSLVSASLGGNTPGVGTGAWSIVSGGTGTFSNSTSGSSTFTANAYGTYVLRWTISNGGCTSTADVTVNYNTAPTIFGNPGSRCGTGIVTISASASAGIINWYAAPSGGSSLSTGAIFTTPSISVTTSYYAESTNGGCTSARVKVDALIIIPPSITAGGGGTFCSGTNATLTSSSTTIDNQYWTGPNNYYSLAQNPTLSNVTTATTGSYTVKGSKLSGINLVSNGDFELGNIGFVSSYVLAAQTPTGLVPEGYYDVVKLPSSRHTNFCSCGDHTSGTGLQMAINGAVTAGVTIWSQTLVNVVPNTDYQFTYWLQTIVLGNDPAPSQLQFYVNGIVAGPIKYADPTTGVWTQFTYNWNSGASTSANLSLINQNTIAGGNDFALDDIVFQQACEATASVNITVNAVVTAGTIAGSQTICSGRTPATLTSTDGTGTGTISYEWQTNAGGSYVTITGATAAIYSPPALAATTSYQRRTVSLSGGTTCYSPYTLAVTITVAGPVATAGGLNTVCQAVSPSAIPMTGASFSGTATSATWSIVPPIVGVLSSTASLNTSALVAAVTYTPAANYSGNVTLRLTTNAVGGCSSISDRTINVNATATAIAGTTVITCSNSGAVNITAGSSSTNYSAVTWTSNGSGTFTNANSLTTCTYTPSAADITAGSRTLTLTATGNSPCANAVSTKTLTITSAPTAVAGTAITTCSASGSVNITAGSSATNYATNIWTSSGTGTFANATSLTTATYTPSAADITAGSVIFSLTATGNSPCANAVSTKTLTITTLPIATISYSGTPFCKSVAVAQSVNRTGTAGGTYSTAPSGLAIDAGTGAITPSTSMVGTYTVTYTMAASGGCTVQTASCSVNVNPTPTIAAKTATSCSGSAFTVSPIDGADIVPSGTTYSWSAPVVPGITGTAAGTNAPSITGTLINTTNAAINVTYTVTPLSGSCTNSAFSVTVTVNPVTAVTAMTSMICSAGSFTAIPVNSANGIVPSGTTYSWSAPAVPGITGTAAGTNAPSITGALTNTTNAAINVTYTVTPLSGSCTGSIFTVTVTVNPVPAVTAMTSTICSAGSFTATPVNSANGIVPAGTTYSWSAPAVPGITGMSAGTNAASITGTLTNTTNAAINVTYTVTPLSGSCTGSTFTLTVTVNPVPAVTAMNSTICSAGSFTATPVNSANGIVPAGTTYSWSAPAVPGITGTAAGTNAPSITGTLTNTTNAAINVTYTVTPLSGSCTGSTFTLTVTVNPVPAVAAMTSTICSAGSFTATPVNSANGIVPSGTTYSWSAPAVPGITGMAAGTNASSISGTLINTTNAAINVTYTVTPLSGSCTGSTFTETVTVNPVPAVTAMTSTICSAGSFTATPVNSANGIVPAGTTYSWSAPAVTGITGAAAGTNAASISGTLTNTTNAAINVTYTVTPLSGSCTGSTFTVTVTVNPVPAVTAMTSTICSAGSFTATPVNSANGIVPAGTTYSWSAPAIPGITGMAAGTNASSISGTLINTTNAAINVTYTVTPLSGSCTGSIFTVTVTVNPVPAVTAMTSTICSAGSFTATPVNSANGIVPSGTNYSWSVPAVPGITGTAAGTNAPSITGTLTNTTNAAINVTYTVTPLTGSCTGNTFNVTVTVNPVPAVTAMTSTICSAGSFTATPVNSANGIVPSGTNYSWSVPAVPGITGMAAGTNAPSITGTLTNTTNAAINVTYTVTPLSGSCTGSIFTVTVTVNPVPSVAAMTSTICSAGSFTATPVNGTNGIVPSGTTYSWSVPAIPGITGTAAGTNAPSITGTLTNTTNAAINVTYTVTPLTGSCTGNTFNVTVTVNPVPAVTAMTSTICSAGSFTATPVNSANGIVPSGTTYSWSAPTVPGITGMAAGTNAPSISGTLTNTTNAAINVIYTVTPLSGSCTGSTFTVTVTVNPVPAVTAMTSTICSAGSFTAIPVNSANGIVPSGTTFSWSVPAVPGITGMAAGTNASSITGTLTNTTNAAINVTYTVTPLSGSCTGSTFNVTVTVNPVPAVTAMTSTICSAGSFTATPVNNSNGIVPSGTTYSWSAPTVTGGLTGGMSGTLASVINGTLINLTNEVQTGTYIVTPTSGSCNGNTFTVTITVNPDGSWTGAIDNNWNNPGNWACNELPLITTNVIIANGRPHYPTLSSEPAGTSKNLTIENNASVTVVGNKLQIGGAISNLGTFTASAGTIEMKGTLAQTIGANVFTGNTIMNLTINNSAGATLQGKLNVTRIVTALNGNLSSGGNLTLVSSSLQTALIDGTGGGDVWGNVNMQRYLPSAFGYKYFSSPFQSATVSEFATTVNLLAAFPSFYKYNENNSIDSSGVTVYTSGWAKYINSGSVLVPLAGYAANLGPDAAAPAITARMTGVVNNGTLQTALFNHNRKYTKGFNLIGNPYPSPIDWNAPGWTKTNIDNALYFFNASGSQYSGAYSSYVNGVSSGIADNVIAAMQGFFVHVANGTFPVGATLGVTNSVRINNLNPIFKRALIDTRAILRFTANFETKNALDDAAVIYFDNSAHLRFDQDMDALKMTNTDLLVPNIYTLTPESTHLQINGMPYPTDSITRIPLGITTFTEGWINLKANDISQLPSCWYIYLVDAETGKYRDLKQLPDYRFYLKSGEYNGRFTLVFSLSKLTELTVNAGKMFTLSRSANFLSVNVKLPYNTKGNLMVTNSLGQIVLRKGVFENETVEINQNVSTGVYVITLISGQSTHSEKIIMRKDYE